MNPAFLMMAISLTTCLASLLFSDADFRRLWRVPKVVTDYQVAEFSLLFLIFSFSATATLALRPARLQSRRNLTRSQVRTLIRAEQLFFFLTMFGYSAFVIQALRKGLVPTIFKTLATLDFSSGVIEDNLTTIPGLSTMTQFAVAEAVIAGTLISMRVSQRLQRRLIRHLVTSILLAALRATLLTERLAVLELVIPMLAALLSFTLVGTRAHKRASAAPLVLGPIVIAIFGASEYTRSWQWYKTHGTTNFGRFVLERLAGYYVTAYNNAGIRDQHTTRASLPYDTWEFFWRAPLIQNLNLFEKFTGTKVQEYFDNLATYGNPEFNNQSGVSGPIMDYGWWGSILFFIVFGIATALIYRSFREGRSTGLLMYPVLFLTLLEYPRYMWVAGGRAFPSMVALILLSYLLSRQRAHDLVSDSGKSAPARSKNIQALYQRFGVKL